MSICHTCEKDYTQSHNTQRFCTDECTPYKNPLMGWDVWRSMHKRCYDSGTNGYDKYGGRGIIVCDSWFDYRSFHKDMKNRPSVKHQLDRINNNGNYEPDNCEWVTSKENVFKRDATKKIEYNGVVKNISDWAKELGLAKSTFANRINNWGVELAFSTPKGPTGPKPKRS